MGSWDDPTEKSVFGPDECNATIKKSRALIDPNYNEEATVLRWELETDDPEFEEHTVQYSLGNGWESDDGKNVRHVKKKTKFNENSMYGRIINRAVGVGNGEEYAEGFKGVLDVLKERGDPTDVTIWEGLSFRFVQEELDFGRGWKSNRLMPVEFLGEDVNLDDTDNKGGGQGKANSNGNKESADDVRKKVEDLATRFDNHSDFMDAALKVRGATSDDDLFTEIMDDGPDGIFEKMQNQPL